MTLNINKFSAIFTTFCRKSLIHFAKPKARLRESIVGSVFFLGLLTMGCAPNGSYVDIETLYAANDVTPDSLVTDPNSIQILTESYPERSYQSLGDIRARAYGFGSMESVRADLNWALRQEAARLGADAVIYAKYGNRTIREMSAITYDATGTAIKLWNPQ